MLGLVYFSIMFFEFFYNTKPVLTESIFPCFHNFFFNFRYPDIVSKLKVILQRYNDTALPPGNLPLDPRGNPEYWNYVWTNFGDYISESPSTNVITLYM